MIEIKNLSYVYQKGTVSEHKALTDINLTIHDGETAAVIGHTGSGKSTLIQQLNGLLRPTHGRVLIDGKDIAGMKTKDICRRVGLVFQYPENQLFEETVYKDIAFGPKNLGLDDAEIKKRVSAAAAMVGLDEACFNKSPFELSGGQMRRAAIAGALAMKPKILVLDEPMAGLDGKGRKSVIDMIRKLRAENKDMTVIFVSHSMEDIAEVAERVIVMNRGKVEMDGTVSEVFSRSARLREIGLDTPAVTEVMRRLRSLGYNAAEMYTVESAAAEIKRLLAGVTNA